MLETSPNLNTALTLGNRHSPGERLMRFYSLLASTFGYRNWWPARTREEIVIGAVLTQNVSWVNAAKGIANLQEAGWLSLEAIHKTRLEDLAPLLIPTRFFNVKANRLKALTNWLYDNYGGALDSALGQPTDVLRRSMLSVNGLGKETVDSILLYAGNHLLFVVDAYTLRIVNRWGLTDETATYDSVQRMFMMSVPADVDVYGDFHAQIVHLGHHICWKNAPRCATCPLGHICVTGASI